MLYATIFPYLLIQLKFCCVLSCSLILYEYFLPNLVKSSLWIETISNMSVSIKGTWCSTMNIVMNFKVNEIYLTFFLITPYIKIHRAYGRLPECKEKRHHKALLKWQNYVSFRFRMFGGKLIIVGWLLSKILIVIIMIIITYYLEAFLWKYKSIFEFVELLLNEY